MSSPKTAELRLIRGTTAFQRVIELYNVNVSIGSSPKNDVKWNVEGISGEHAMLEYVSPTWHIRNLSSGKVIHLNGRMMEKGEQLPLNDSDIIRFVHDGSIQYKFRYEQLKESRSRYPSRDIAKTTRNWLGILSPPASHNVTLSSRSKPGRTEAPGPSSANQASGIPADHLRAPSLPGFMSDKEITKCRDIDKLKQQLRKCSRKVAGAEAKLKMLKAEKAREKEESRRRETDLLSLRAAISEENSDKILDILERELSCAVCSDVFIQATVLDCGHTFCNYCISQCSKTQKTCPVCRAAYLNPSRHTELENFISKMFDSLSEEISTKRREAVKEREGAVKKAAQAQARAVARAAATAGNSAGVNPIQLQSVTLDDLIQAFGFPPTQSAGWDSPGSVRTATFTLRSPRRVELDGSNLFIVSPPIPTPSSN